MTKHLIPETPARRLPVTFDYAHSAPIVAAGRVLSGDRSDELEMVRDAADGFIAAVRNSREGLCHAASGLLLCTRRVGHDPPHVCAKVQVVALDIWVEE